MKSIHGGDIYNNKVNMDFFGKYQSSWHNHILLKRL